MPKAKRTWSRRYEINILKNYALATPEDIHTGLFWYQATHNEAQSIATKYSVELWQAVGVIAALSPGCNWGRNLLDADTLIHAHVNGLNTPVVGVYGKVNTNKALDILRGAYPLGPNGALGSGPKTIAFFSNILFPLESLAVTVDRHTKAIVEYTPSLRLGYASNNSLSVVWPSEYEFIAWHYRVIAERVGLLPHQLQAISWVCWKRRGEERELEVPF